MSSESIQPIEKSCAQAYPNADGSPCTWVTYRERQDRLKSAIKPTLIGAGLSIVIWVIQYANDALGANWQFALWLLGIGMIAGFFGYAPKEIRHYSTTYVAYTKKQRLARAWKWWAIPIAMCIFVLVVLHSRDQLADYWPNGLYMLIFSIPGFGLYMLKGERVLTPNAAAAKTEIEAAELREGGKKGPVEEALEALVEVAWVRYPLAIGCFWIAYWMSEQEFKKPYLGVMAALFFAGIGIYFAREASKWIFGLAAAGLIVWAIVAGVSEMSIPAAIIIVALIIANSSAKR